MFHIKSRRTAIRLISYSLTAFVVAVGLAVSGFVTAYNFRMNIEYSYERSLMELSEHVNAIDLALQKGIYASTSSQLVGLAAQIWSDTGAAKSDLSELSLSNVNLANTTKFIAQVGDYADTLAKSLSYGGKISNGERNTIRSLSGYAEKLSNELGDMTNEVQAGTLTLFKSEKAINGYVVSSHPTVADGFADIENNMTGMPSMIYDGPFSDNVLKKMPELTKGKAAVTADAAQGIAAGFLPAGKASLKADGQTGGDLPTYNFTQGGNMTIYVAKYGGYVVRMINNRAVSVSKLDNAGAEKSAEAYLKSRGISGMTLTYSMSQDNICAVNFAYTQNGVVCYPDMIKLSVAMDTGEIISFDATGYIMNHKPRSFPAAVSRSTADRLINPLLKVQSVSYALIPSGGGDELLCYEYKCLNDKKQTVIDYFNVVTGREENLVIVQNSPGGYLPM